MKIITVHSFIKAAGLLVVAAMLGTACSAVDPEESDPQENDNGKSEKIPTPDSYKYPIPEAVDLGLSVKWASINLFADEPYSVRGHLAWGGFYNTVFSWSHYRLCEGSKITLTRYNSEKEYGKVDNKKEFKDYNYQDDAARAYLGGNWHIPTVAEWQELIDNCTWKWERGKYIPDPLNPKRNIQLRGYRVTSKKSGYTEASIFLPCAGYYQFNSEKMEEEYLYAASLGFYWSSTASTAGDARSVELSIDGAKLRHTARFKGLSIRPVTD